MSQPSFSRSICHKFSDNIQNHVRSEFVIDGKSDFNSAMAKLEQVNGKNVNEQIYSGDVKIQDGKFRLEIFGKKPVEPLAVPAVTINSATGVLLENPKGVPTFGGDFSRFSSVFGNLKNVNNFGDLSQGGNFESGSFGAGDSVELGYF